LSAEGGSSEETLHDALYALGELYLADRQRIKLLRQQSDQIVALEEEVTKLRAEKEGQDGGT
jgi:hypothetical protein